MSLWPDNLYDAEGRRVGRREHRWYGTSTRQHIEKARKSADRTCNIQRDADVVFLLLIAEWQTYFARSNLFVTHIHLFARSYIRTYICVSKTDDHFSRQARFNKQQHQHHEIKTIQAAQRERRGRDTASAYFKKKLIATSFIKPIKLLISRKWTS